MTQQQGYRDFISTRITANRKESKLNSAEQTKLKKNQKKKTNEQFKQ
jgi:hypothetical protein